MPKNLFSYDCDSRSMEEFGPEQSLQVILAGVGPGCKVVQQIFCVALKGMR